MYEADSQLAFLNKSGLADYVISEDSDLILFGCTRIIFKLQLDGRCLLFDSENLPLTMNTTAEKFSFDKFRQMCILSGCDYLDNLPGIGLAKARKFIMMTEETDMSRALLKIPSYLNMKKLTVTDEYIKAFQSAEATFKYMFVFDPKMRQMIRLNPIDENDPEIVHCTNAGELLDAATAFQLALGNINPRSFKLMDNFDPDVNAPTKQRPFGRQSIWKSENNAPKTAARNPRHQTNISKFFCNPPKKEKALAEVQNIMEQENDVTCEVEMDDLVNSYCMTELSTSKRRNSYHDEDDCEDEKNVSITKNPFAKRHQPANTTPGKPSLLKSLGSDESEKTSEESIERNLKVISRFFVKSKTESSLFKPDTKKLFDDPDILSVAELKKEQYRQFYETFESDEPSSSQKSDGSDSLRSPDEETLSEADDAKTEVVDLDHYAFKVKTQKQTFINNSKPKTTSNPVKPRAKPGLNKAKSFIKTSSTDSTAQTKLSKFGFQTKSKMTLWNCILFNNILLPLENKNIL